MKVYHKDICIPCQLSNRLLGKRISLSYSNHAKHACIDDRYGMIKPVLNVILSLINVIEVYVNERDMIFKVLIREKQNDLLDRCSVISLLDSVVITTWLCKREDIHATLDKNNYENK